MYCLQNVEHLYLHFWRRVFIQAEIFHSTDKHLQVESSHDASHVNPFEFIPQTSTPNLPSTSHTPQPQANPYVQETNAMTYYQGSHNFSQPVRLGVITTLGAVAEISASFNIIFMLLWAHIESIYDRTKGRQEIYSFPRTYARRFKGEMKLHYQYSKVC